MKKQGLAQAVQQQARKLWDNYGLQKGYAECEYFAYSNQIFLSVETSNRTTFTVLEDVPVSQFEGMTSKDIYIDLLERLLVVIDDFEPEEKYNELVGGQLPQSKDVGLVTHDLTVSGNNATSLLPHYTWLHHWVVDSPHLTNTFTH